MSSYTELANRALDELSKSNITSLNEASNEATKIRTVYQSVRDSLLQSYPWRFARKVAALAPIAVNNRSGLYTYAYAEPGDILKLRRVMPDAELGLDDITPWPYEHEEGTIYTNSSPAYAEYTWRLTDSAKFTPEFEDAYVAKLAERVCMPLTKNISLKGQLIQLARTYFIIASTADANDSYNTTDVASETIKSRS